MKTIIEEQKEICNKLVGLWYLENNQQIVEFDLLERLSLNARILIKNENQQLIDTRYGVGVLPKIEATFEINFYIDIWTSPEKKYLIKSITRDKLILQIHNFYEPTNMFCTYVRKIDVDFVDEMLQGLHCI